MRGEQRFAVWQGLITNRGRTKNEGTKGMKITHIDGNKANNTLANLKLEPIQQGAA